MKRISCNARFAHIAGALCALGLSVTAIAQNLVSNGPLTGPIPPSNGTATPSLPPGWAAGTGNVDMHESGGLGFFGEQLPNSPGGTEFVAAVGGAYSGGVTDESFRQTLDNLVVGQQYQLSFYQVNLGVNSTSTSFTYRDSGSWEVRFGSSVFNSPSMPFLGFGADDFSLVTVSFVAGANTQVLEFIAHDGGTVDNNLAYLGIDDIVLVPEPGTCVLLAFGGMVLAASVLRRRRSRLPVHRLE